MSNGPIIIQNHTQQFRSATMAALGALEAAGDEGRAGGSRLLPMEMSIRTGEDEKVSLTAKYQESVNNYLNRLTSK